MEIEGDVYIKIIFKSHGKEIIVKEISDEGKEVELWNHKIDKANDLGEKER